MVTPAQPTPEQLLRLRQPPGPGSPQYEAVTSHLDERQRFIEASPECRRRKFCDNVMPPAGALAMVGTAVWLSRRQGWGWGATVGIGVATLWVSIVTNVLPFDLMATRATPSVLCKWSWGPCSEAVRTWDATH